MRFLTCSQHKARTYRSVVLLTFALALSFQAVAAVPNIPPAMLAQIKNMSPAEQAALAEQYGIDIPSGASRRGLPDDTTVGKATERLEFFEKTEQQDLEAEIRQQLEDELLTEKQEEELERFGAKLFSRNITTFSLVDDSPVPANYQIGAGDEIDVYIFGKEELEFRITVNRDGSLVLPRVGEINVAGMTFEDVKEIVRAKVKARLVGSTAVISLAKLRAMNVTLAGEVTAPGNYSVSGLASAMQVLYAGGGINDLGTYREIKILRGGEVIATFDTYDILLRGDTSQDKRLISGDTVFVGLAERTATVRGEVKRPAIYELSRDDRLGDLLKMAGGLTASGYAKSASIERRGGSRANVERIQVDLNSLQDLERDLLDGDILSVSGIKEEVYNEVVLRGAVARPGGYAWYDGIKISDLISSVDDDLLSETDLSTALIVRRTGAGLEIEAIVFDLERAITNPLSTANLILRPKDQVLVFTLPYLNESYQKLVAAQENNDKEQDEFSDLNSSPEVEVAEEEEINLEEPLYEDRSELIEEVVFRLEAQAKTPASTKIVEISGDVRLPGKYPLLEDKDLNALIQLAGGFENSAFLKEVEITRINFSDEGLARISTFKAPLREKREDGGFQLQPLDRVRVSRIPNWSYGDAVNVDGSVMFPGSYPIVPGEMLSSVLQRAGGVSENGFIEGAVLIKVEAKNREKQQLERLVSSIQRTALSQSQTREEEDTSDTGENAFEEKLAILQEILDKEGGGRVVIDLPAIVAGDASADIQLEAGDSLFIPEFNNTVTVLGEVRQPGTFQYGEDLTLGDYLDLAAGATVRADEEQTYVIRANGSVERQSASLPLLTFRRSGEAGLKPGDTIIVPVNEEYQPVLARYKEISTVVFQSIASLYPLFRL